MHRLFSSHKRFIGIGLMSAFVIALAVLAALWGFSQTASAQDGVVLVHVNPDGSDYTGNPYCPHGGNPVDDDGDTVVDRAIDDCNNIVGSNHVIRTEGWGEGMTHDWEITNYGSNVPFPPVLGSTGPCGDFDIANQPGWDSANDGEQCIVIRSSTPGDTEVRLFYGTGTATDVVVKQWDSLIDTVILKSPPADVNGDTVIDYLDHHLADQQGTWETDEVVWDESWKRVRSYPPVRLIEIVHGGHEVLVDHQTIDLHQPTEGAIIKAWIEGGKGCTYFTTPTGTWPGGVVPYASFGRMMNGISDAEGRFVGPQLVPDITMPAGLQIPQLDWDGDTVADPTSHHGLTMDQLNYDIRDIYVDTTCEEQAIIRIQVGYPDSPGSLKVPVEEWIGINWVTVEAAKQPQIRWAGEQIVLAKRWALPDDFYPNDNCGEGGDEVCHVCPLSGAVVQYNREAPSPGGLEEGIPNLNALNAPDSVWTIIDPECISRAMYESEHQGQVDVKALVWDFDEMWSMQLGLARSEMDTCIDEFNNPPVGEPMCDCHIGSETVGAANSFNEGLETREELDDCLDNIAREWVQQLEGGLEPGDLVSVFNKHAFLVWYLKIYQAKLDNILLADGTGRKDHNAGKWGGENPVTSEGADSETLNVSQDALLRVTVKGWFFGGNKSGRGAVCVDLNGNGNGLEGDAASEPGLPYPVDQYEQGCADPADEILDHGHWVLPDDLPILAGAYPGFTRQSWDVMNDINEDPPTSGGLFIGPKSTLDSHDLVPRPWVPCILGFDQVLYEPIFCDRKTVAPDLEVTVGDAIMPPLKIRALISDPADAGFLKEADKDTDVGIASLYQQIMIPADPEIPPMVNNGGYDWDSWGWNAFPSSAVLGPYEFYHVFNKPVHLLSDCSPDVPGELCNALIGNQKDQAPDDKLHPRIIEFYTDNRGLGYFFANGDYNLDFAQCRPDPVYGTPDCWRGYDVGTSTIEVIGDYPYFRKHPSVLSNPVEKTWEWGGFKTVTAEPIDATHTAIIAHLKDRDGYCKYDVDINSTVDVVFSPSEHPVQGEEIEFILNTDVGRIINVSPNGVYSAPHVPLGTATVTGLADGVLINRGEAVALAEDERVLGAFGEARGVYEEDECQAWIVIEHPLGAEINVSIIFHDPEGKISRHWPPSELIIGLVQGWNDSCYAGYPGDVEAILTAGTIIDDVLAVYRYDAADTDDPWKRWLPGREDNDLLELNSYDQLFILMAANRDWVQPITAMPVSVDLVGASAEDGVPAAWNSVCYVGADKAAEEATLDIEGDFVIMYQLAKDQSWRRYLPGRPEVPDTLTVLHRFDSVILLVTAEGGTTWVFDP
ncbi:MAG: hypothetical protein ACUVV3_09045 [Dehalococcoidia bacterium]